MTGIILEERPISASGGSRGTTWARKDAAGLEFAAFLFRKPHVLAQFLVQLVEVPSEGAFRSTLGVSLADPLNQSVLDNLLFEESCILCPCAGDFGVQLSGCRPNYSWGRVPDNVP